MEQNPTPTQHKVFAFDKTNFILLTIGILIVVVGLILMAGKGSTTEMFNPEIFSARRVKLAPVVCLFGYLFIVVAIVKRPKDTPTSTSSPEKPE